MVAGLGWIHGIGFMSMKLARTRRIVRTTALFYGNSQNTDGKGWREHHR